MSGNLPAEIGVLKLLERLRLAYCGLRGTSASTVVDEVVDDTLRHRSLRLSMYSLCQGTIPPEIGLLERLQYLSLNNNSFEGS